MSATTAKPTATDASAAPKTESTAPAIQPVAPDSVRLYVTGFERGTAFDVIKEAIVAKGVTVNGGFIPAGRFPKGYGFADVKTSDEQKLLDLSGKLTIGEKTVTVEAAKEPTERKPREPRARKERKPRLDDEGNELPAAAPRRRGPRGSAAETSPEGAEQPERKPRQPRQRQPRRTGPPTGPPSETLLIVHNLPEYYDSASLKELFEKTLKIQVTSVHVPMRPYSKTKCKRFAFVNCADNANQKLGMEKAPGTTVTGLDEAKTTSEITVQIGLGDESAKNAAPAADSSA